MAGDTKTIARPYAEAVFALAVEGNSLDSWSETLDFLTLVVRDPTLAQLLADPFFDKGDLRKLMLEIAGDRLNKEGENLVAVLIESNRLVVVPEIAELFAALKREKENLLNVHVISAFALKPAQEQQLAAALKEKLGRNIAITSEKDPSLIGGVRIRAGDLVIDGSVQGQLHQLAQDLGI